MTRASNVNAGGRKLAVGLALCGLVAMLAQGGCAESMPIDFTSLSDAGASASGGSASGSGGAEATGGTFGTGGGTSSGGNPGTGGVSSSGGVTGTGGVIATGGATGTAGARATGGATGSGGSTGGGGATGPGGGGSTGAGGAAAPTFTQIYKTILSVSCAGSQCHSPGTQGRVSFASQSSAYSALKSRVVAGNASGSSFYTLVNGGRMPPGNKLPAAQISQIAAWINAGALNN